MDEPQANRNRDWFYLQVLEWMWRSDGLGLRPGAELFVYAAIYRASSHGGGTFAATNESLGRVLGYPRETVSRAIGKLVRSGLVWVVGKVHDGHGGKPVKCYAVSEVVIARVTSAIAASHLEGYLADGTRGGEVRIERVASTVAPDITNVENPSAYPQLDGNVTKHHIAQGGDGEASVTKRHAGTPKRDETSRLECDETSRMTKRHIAQNAPHPADSLLFDTPLISSYHLSTDQVDKERARQTSSSDLVGTVLSPLDEQAFQTLLGMSVRPVDPDFVSANRDEFANLISAGITGEVVLAAYADYATYHRRQMVEVGQSRPMHLLNWLRQNPNSNIQYVLNARNDEWMRDHGRSAQPCAEREETLPGSHGAQRPSHENPQLVRCVDRGTHLWYVHDERGSRYVEGSRGIDGETEAMALYERMYDSEATALR